LDNDKLTLILLATFIFPRPQGIHYISKQEKSFHL